MNGIQKRNTADIRAWAPTLRAGEQILLSGVIYTARDAAHKRLTSMIREGQPLPFPLRDSVVYYAGPTPAKNGLPIGSCGPTTSCRMDPYMSLFCDLGLAATIGKGDRDEAVYEALRRTGSIYLCALGGTGALCCQAIRSVEVIAFPELGCESVKRMEICDLPLYVGIDCLGNSIFKRTV